MRSHLYCAEINQNWLFFSQIPYHSYIYLPSFEITTTFYSSSSYSLCRNKSKLTFFSQIPYHSYIYLPSFEITTTFYSSSSDSLCRNKSKLIFFSQIPYHSYIYLPSFEITTTFYSSSSDSLCIVSLRRHVHVTGANGSPHVLSNSSPSASQQQRIRTSAITRSLSHLSRWRQNITN